MKKLLKSIVIIVAATTLIGCLQNLRPLPQGISIEGELHPVPSARFIADYTYLTPNGERHSDQHIFDSIFTLIDEARQLIVLDMFLFNPYQGEVRETTKLLSSELIAKLIAQKKAYPNINIVLITDPVNTVYGGMESLQFNQLREAGIQVVITDLNKLNDSNPFYSGIWRLFIKPFGNSTDGKLLPNPFGEGRVSIRSYLSLLNFKANHRKTILADNKDSYKAIITSANPHDGSSAHGNIAIEFQGSAVLDLLKSENAVLKFSGENPIKVPDLNIVKERDSAAKLKIITEGKIKRALLDTINNTQQGDELYIAVFYISDRDIVRALKESNRRGVALSLIFDPNKDAFGRKKNGIPNRQVALELHREGIPIKWCDTHGEQCHAKMLLAVYNKNNKGVLIAGSANFTRRNLNDLNLETNIYIEGATDSSVLKDALHYFNTIWSNDDGRHFSTDFEAFKDTSYLKKLMYRFMEFSGVSTF